jgi:hypothetical protein
MKTLKIMGRLCFFLGIILVISSCKHIAIKKLNLGEFQNPPFESSVHAWWHWLDNSITKEGITKDLEAMKKQGISAATILNVGLLGERDMGVPQAKFNSEEWFQLFEWALKEADRLGMKIGAHNCDGWSSSGGPWISPESSMKRCVWSRTILQGGTRTSIKLPEPKKNMDFYQDIKVLAFPAKAEESSFQQAKAAISVNGTATGDLLYDGDPFSMIQVKEGSRMDIVFNKDFTATRIALHPRVEFVWGSLANVNYQVELKASNDGRTFKTVQQFVGPVPNKTTIIQIKPTIARFYRLEFGKIAELDDASVGISEMELLGNDEVPAYNTHIPSHLQKTVTTMPDQVNEVLTQGTDNPESVPYAEIQDITQYMSPDGNLSWEAPAGKWEVLRIGYTTTGATNAPGTKAGTGLECDKMDTAAMNLHFRSFPAKLIAHAGKYAGNTFEYLFIDSWECRYQNWTKNFAEEFEKRRHYSMVNWLPAICGITVNDNASTERFLHDFRQTIADLIEENYYKQFNILCHQYGVKSHAEIIYGGSAYPPLDILKSNRYVDVPMFEFWAGFDKETKLVNYDPVKATAFEIPVQAGALYGKQVIPAESYTGYANYSESPWDLKLFGDRAFCTGINQMVLHSYVHQPFEKKPGVTLGVFGQSFNRHNPWWDFSSQWFAYHARVQYILQQGVPVADILYFVGDRYYQEAHFSGLYEVPEGFQVQKCNLDILTNHCKVKNGKLLLDNGLSYEMLLLPDDQQMEAGTLKRIAELVRAGAVISGPKPLQVAGNLNFAENEKALQSLSDEVWGKAGTSGIFENTYGQGKVYSGTRLKDILEKLKLNPDFSGNHEGMANLLYIHKKMGTSDVYFVVNQEDKIVERDCIFRTAGKATEIWDPESGMASLPADSHETDGLTVVKIRFRPKESLFFIFNDTKTPGLPIRQDLKKNFVLQDFKGTLEFEDLQGKAPVQISNFTSWTNNPDPDIKYYSGKAKYVLNFDLPADLANTKPVYISLDAVKAAYEINLNGKLLGYSAFPGYRFDVSGILREKDNKMEIRVANTWRNRVIGDFTQFGQLKNCWTTSPVDILPGKDMPLLESGILGPIALYY